MHCSPSRPRAGRASLLALFALALFASPSFAKQDFDTVAECLAAARSGDVRFNRIVTIKRVQITTRPVDSSSHDEYSMWFYVNDKDRNGDGILFSFPTYWTSGSDPFDEDSEDPFEADIHFPDFKRGWEISVSGYLEERDDGKGWHLKRSADYWSYDDDFHDFEVEHEGTDDETHTIRAVFDVHARQTMSAPPRPSRLRVLPGRTARPGQTLIISARNVGDRGRVLWNGQFLVTSFDRRPGLFMVRVPRDAAAGVHRLQIRNPESGTSRAVRITVRVPTLPAPRITSVTRTGSIVVIRGENFHAKGPTERTEIFLGNRKLSPISIDADVIMLERSGTISSSSKFKVKIGDRTSNRVSLSSSSGISGSLNP